MATLITTELPHHIEQLLKERATHAAAIAQIDKTLAGVSAALNGGSPARSNGATAAVIGATPKPSVAKRRRGTRGVFAVSGEASVLAFIKQKKTATTREVNQHFKSEGRASTADNALSKLVKEKKLKRLPLGKGIPGSAYTLA